MVCNLVFTSVYEIFWTSFHVSYGCTVCILIWVCMLMGDPFLAPGWVGASLFPGSQTQGREERLGGLPVLIQISFIVHQRLLSQPNAHFDDAEFITFVLKRSALSQLLSGTHANMQDNGFVSTNHTSEREQNQTHGSL